jgi:hypothetical protein
MSPPSPHKPKDKKKELLIAPAAEGALILVLAAIGWATRTPLIFASLGPTAYEMIEQPTQKSARPYNVIAGHFVALGAGFFALWVLNAWSSPKVAASGFVAGPRLWAALLAVVLAALVTLLINATQPASMATALLVSLGSMQTARDALWIAVAVLIITAIAEPVRRQRAKAMQSSPPKQPAAVLP